MNELLFNRSSEPGPLSLCLLNAKRYMCQSGMIDGTLLVMTENRCIR